MCNLLTATKRKVIQQMTEHHRNLPEDSGGDFISDNGYYYEVENTL